MDVGSQCPGRPIGTQSGGQDRSSSVSLLVNEMNLWEVRRFKRLTDQLNQGGSMSAKGTSHRRLDNPLIIRLSAADRQLLEATAALRVLVRFDPPQAEQ